MAAASFVPQSHSAQVLEKSDGTIVLFCSKCGRQADRLQQESCMGPSVPSPPVPLAPEANLAQCAPQLAHSVGRLLTRSSDSEHWVFSGQCCAVTPNVFLTAAGGCLSGATKLQLLVLLKPTPHTLFPLRATVIRHDAELDLAALVVLDEPLPPVVPLAIAADVSGGMPCALAIFFVSDDLAIMGERFSQKSAADSLPHQPSVHSGTITNVHRYPTQAELAAFNSGDAAIAAAALAAAVSRLPWLVAGSGYTNESGCIGGAVLGAGGQGALPALLGVHVRDVRLASSATSRSASSKPRPRFLVLHAAMARLEWTLEDLVTRATQQRIQHAADPPAADTADLFEFHIRTRGRRSAQAQASSSPPPFCTDELYNPEL